MLSKICELQFGGVGAERLAELRKHLQRFAATQRAEGRASVSRQAINGWFSESIKINRATSFEFIYTYLLLNVRKSSKDADFETYQNTVNYVKQHHNVMNNFYPGAKESLFQDILDTSAALPKTQLNDLFSTSPISSEADLDQSYYLLYRHSIISGRLLKTFLVCKPPQKGQSDQYTFAQFAHGGQTDFLNSNNVYRESYGIVLKMVKAYYFVGSNYSIPLDKETVSLETYESTRMHERKNPVAIELIVAEHDDIRVGRSLFPGLIATVGPNGEPVLARVAFVHLGTARSLSKFLRDDIVRPTALDRDKLENDLACTVVRMRDAGCQRMGRVLERAAGGGMAQLAERILAMVINLPSDGADSTNPNGAGWSALLKYSA